jgi:DNA-binding beta-propeller fold protein YncE
VLNFIGGPAKSAKLSSPTRIALDTTNNLMYIADNFNHAIRVVDRTSGNITKFAGTYGSSGSAGDGGQATSAQLNYPYDIAVDSVRNKVYITDTYSDSVRVVDRSNGNIYKFAGGGTGNGLGKLYS